MNSKHEQPKPLPNITIEQFRNSCDNVIVAGNQLKLAMIKARIQRAELDDGVERTFLLKMLSETANWKDRAEVLQQYMRSYRPDGVNYHGLLYDQVKPYLTANHDYAASLAYTDGVWNGVKNGKFKTPGDIDDFYQYTINKAFRDWPDAVVGIMDDACDVVTNAMRGTPSELQHLKQALTTQFYHAQDINELRSSIGMTIHFLKKEVSDKSNTDETIELSLFANMVYSSINFIIYSIIAYASRVFVISRYVSPIYDTTPYSESTKIDMPYLNIMQTADDNLFRDYSNTGWKKFHDLLTKWKCAITNEDMNKNPDERDVGVTSRGPTKDMMKQNRFHHNLYGNPLYDMFRSYFYIYPDSVAECHRTIKGYLVNTLQGIQTSDSAKQQLLTEIRDTKPESETIEGYRKLATDLYHIAVLIMARLNSNLGDLDHIPIQHDQNPSYTMQISELKRMLSLFYREFGMAVVYRAREIEQKLNQLMSNELDKVHQDIAIKIPGMKKDENDQVMQMAVPNMTRDLNSFLEESALPYYVWLEGMDYYKQSLLGILDNAYYTEAVNLQSIINAILAKIRSWHDQLKTFLENRSVIKGFQWILKHENQITNLSFHNATINVLPYKVNLSKPKGFDNLITRLQSATPDNFKTPEAKDAFIRSLYPDETIAGWFLDPNAEERKKAPIKYRNLILFGMTNGNAEENISKVPLSDNNIATTIRDVWVPTVAGGPTVLRDHRSTTDKLYRAVDDMKRRVVSASMQSAQQQQDSNTPPSISQKNDQAAANSGTSNAQQNQNAAEKHGNDINIEAAIGEIMQVIENVWGSMTSMMITYMRDAYQYLQVAYALGTKQS